MHDAVPFMRSGSACFGCEGELRNFCDSAWHPRHRVFGNGWASLIGVVYRPVVLRQTWPSPWN